MGFLVKKCRDFWLKNAGAFGYCAFFYNAAISLALGDCAFLGIARGRAVGKAKAIRHMRKGKKKRKPRKGGEERKEKKEERKRQRREEKNPGERKETGQKKGEKRREKRRKKGKALAGKRGETLANAQFVLGIRV